MQQVRVLAAVVAVDPVVRAHDAGHARRDRALEVRQVHLAQRALVHPHVHGVSGLLDAIEGEVLHAGHDVVVLDAPYGRRRHLPEEVRVFTVGLLGAAPAGMAKQVDAYAAPEVRPLGPQLLADGIGDSGLEVAVEAGASRHGHRERGGVVEDHALRPVREQERRDQQPRVAPRGNGPVVVFEAIDRGDANEVEEPGVARHLVDLLLQAHRAEQPVHVPFHRGFAQLRPPWEVGQLEDVGPRGPDEEAVGRPLGVRPPRDGVEPHHQERRQAERDPRSEAEGPAHVHGPTSGLRRRRGRR